MTTHRIKDLSEIRERIEEKIKAFLAEDARDPIADMLEKPYAESEGEDEWGLK